MQHTFNVYWVMAVVCGLYFLGYAWDKWIAWKKSAAPSAADIANCNALLRFLQTSFRGATIGDLKMDELAASLAVVIRAVKPPEEEP